MTSPVLLDALERFAGTGPEFGGFLANHGPMAVEAMTTMNGEVAVEAWVDQYVGRLDDAPRPGRVVTDDNWREWLGEARLVGDWTTFFLGRTLEMGWQSLLSTWWPRLLSGLAASATHGMIRTAHAVRTLSAAGEAPDQLLTDELARGLGLWAARYQTLPSPLGSAGKWDAVTALSRLPRLPAGVPSRGEGVTGRLAVLDSVAGLPAGLSRWHVPDATQDALTELVGAAARVVAARPDAPIAFCHTVTAPAAVRLVLPHLPPEVQRDSVSAAWQAVAGIVAAYADPRHPEESTSIRLPDEEVTRLLDRLPAAAFDHGDEHVIKLSEAAIREHRISQNATLLVAADRFRSRV